MIESLYEPTTQIFSYTAQEKLEALCIKPHKFDSIFELTLLLSLTQKAIETNNKNVTITDDDDNENIIELKLTPWMWVVDKLFNEAKKNNLDDSQVLKHVNKRLFEIWRETLSLRKKLIKNKAIKLD